MKNLLVDWQAIGNQALEVVKTVGIKLLEVIGIFIAGYIVIKIIIGLLKKIFAKSKMSRVTYKFLLSVLKFCLYMLLLLGICQFVGIPITGFIALLSAAGLAISLAMQGSLSNLANGVVIIGTHPFKEGDYIAIDNIEGTVTEIKMLHTIIATTDNKIISIPNSKVVESSLINYSANSTRKVYFNFGVDYSSDVEKVKSIILDVITNCNKVLLDPTPFCALKSLDSSSITFVANCWCLSNDYWDVDYFVMENVFNEFKRNNISIPFEQMEVRLRNDTVEMPYNKTPMEKRNEEIAVKPVETLSGDAIDIMLYKLSKKTKEKKLIRKQQKAKNNKTTEKKKTKHNKTEEKQD